VIRETVVSVGSVETVAIWVIRVTRETRAIGERGAIGASQVLVALRARKDQQAYRRKLCQKQTRYKRISKIPVYTVYRSKINIL
jgi:hypothetical protein